MTCPSCRRRKGRRACPAEHAAICSYCCGSKRQVEIACPSDCHYLTGEHASAWDGHSASLERDQRRVLTHALELSDPQRALMLAALVQAGRLHRTHRHLSDAVLHAAVVTLRKSAETRERGILYEHRAEDEGIQTVVLALRHAFAEHAAEGRVTEPSDQDLLPVLRALDQALAECMKTESDDQAFLGSAARLTARFSEPRPAAHLIVTP